MASLKEEKEKVTNGLKCCVEPEWSIERCRDQCPYYNSVYEGDIWANCRDELMMDALILLQKITKYG